jgi:hypothetical protein
MNFLRENEFDMGWVLSGLRILYTMLCASLVREKSLRQNLESITGEWQNPSAPHASHMAPGAPLLQDLFQGLTGMLNMLA